MDFSNFAEISHALPWNALYILSALFSPVGLKILWLSIMNSVFALPHQLTNLCVYLRIEYLILSVYWSVNVRWRVTNRVNLRSLAEQVYT